MTNAELKAFQAEQGRPSRTLAPGQFSIAALLVLTLWVAACLALYRASPVIGGAIGLWTVPAAVRGLYSIQYWKRRRDKVSWADVYDIYGSSLVLTAASELAGLIAFGFGCLAIVVITLATDLPREMAAWAALVHGLIAGVLAAGFVLWLGRPSRFDRPT